MLKQTLLLILLITAVSCGEQENNNEQIYGSWKAISWTVAGIENLDESSNVSFQFNDDDTYTGKANELTQEEGIYRLSGTRLYTTEEGKLEKMIKVELSGADTLTMFMNRSGTSETMILVKTE